MILLLIHIIRKFNDEKYFILIININKIRTNN
jgi:hypothetical protein